MDKCPLDLSLFCLENPADLLLSAAVVEFRRFRHCVLKSLWEIRASTRDFSMHNAAVAPETGANFSLSPVFFLPVFLPLSHCICVSVCLTQSHLCAAAIKTFIVVTRSRV